MMNHDMYNIYIYNYIYINPSNLVGEKKIGVHTSIISRARNFGERPKKQATNTKFLRSLTP